MTRVTNRVTETQDDAVLDIQVDVTVDDVDTLNDLSCVHMGDASRFVGVAVSSDDIGDAAV